MHASIGPSCAVADFSDGRLTVWTGTQNPHMLRADLNRLLKLGEDRIDLVRLEAAGCYGRNCADDVCADAALLSIAVGAPVRVQLSREQEHQWEPKGTGQLMDVAAAINADGDLLAYDFAVRYPSNDAPILALLLTGAIPGEPRTLEMGDRTAAPPYRYPNRRVVCHDMGLVGFVLTPVATQLSVDYLQTQDFAMRPKQWLNLMSRNWGTVSVAPPFGYDLCVRRCSSTEVQNLDLSHWRVAGVGAEPIAMTTLDRFAEHFAPAGFKASAFMPCYGLAENTLAVSFAAPDLGGQTDRVDRDILELESRAIPATERSTAISTFVNCGGPLPGHQVQVLDEAGNPLPERSVGRIVISGPSLMQGYFHDPESKRQLAETQQLDTGDLGYLLNGNLYVTGRKKDLIIIRGRNIWPQDIELVAETEADVRPGDVIVFIVDKDGEPAVVMQVQCRILSLDKRERLVHTLFSKIHSEFGVSPTIDLVPPHSIPRTSSGKPARAEARKRFLSQLSMAPHTLTTAGSA